MEEKIIIYGLGEIGKILACYFTECEHKKVDAIFVSEGHRELEYYQTPKSLSGVVIPVLELEKENPDLKNTICYVTVVSGKNEIIEKCMKYGAQSAKIIDAVPFFKSYRDEFYESYLNSLGATVKNGVMTFNGVQTIDFMSVPQLKGTFEGTICDEIIPLVYDDFSLTVDGPYLDKNLGVDLQEGEYVVDAGANLGLFACYAAHHGCHVYACDPDIQCVSALEKQRELYPDRIEVIPLGLSDREGEEKFYESEGCSLSSIYMPRGNTVEKTIKINTIDNLVANGIFEKVDYIKADIEGAERYMLMGAVETMRIQAPKLSICTYHYKDDPVVLENIIKNANPDYVISHNWRKLYAYVPK